MRATHVICPKCDHHILLSNGPERFWSQVDKTADCWVWLGTRTKSGYGSVRIDGRRMQCHRYSWELTCGTIPDEQLVLHRCDNRPCVNPAHLFLGTYEDNNKDRASKGRGNHPCGSKNYFAKMNETSVLELRKLVHEGISYSELGRRYGISKNTARLIAIGKKWAHV